MNKNYLIYYISKIRKKSRHFIEKGLENEGLKGLCSSHGTILSALYSENRALSMKEISKIIYRNKSTTSQLVDKLVSGGYVKKTRCRDDGRISYVVLTDKGREIQPAFKAISASLIEKAYENFSDDETKELLRLLKKLSTNFS